MEISAEKNALFDEQLAQQMGVLRNATLAGKDSPNYNPNITYGSILSDMELKQIAKLSPKLSPLLNETRSPEKIQEIKDQVAQITERRINLYNRAPIDFDVTERFPEYTRELETYNALINQDSPMRERISQFEEGAGMPPDVSAPLRPIGLENAEKIAARGFEPDNELKFENFKEGAKFRTKVGFAPRHMTKEDWDYLGKQHGLKGTYIYVDPNDPSLGVAFKAEGEEDYKLVNTPYLTAEDTYKFLVNEVPAIAADIGLLVYGGKKFGAGTGLYGNLPTRALSVLGLSGLSATGAAGGDFVRLTMGSAMGAHDRAFMDIFKESGLMGALAFAGTGVISTATHIIPAVWQSIKGTKVPAEFFSTIREMLKRAQASEQGEAIVRGGIGTETTMKEINTAIDDLTNRFKADLSGYNPTLASRTGDIDAADLEALFLKYADDLELRALYDKIKLGNQEAITRFVEVLGEKIGPTVGADITAAQVGAGIRGTLNEKIARLNDESYSMIANVRNNLLKAEDIALPGQTLLKKVPDEKASTPLFERTQKRLKELKDNYITGFRQEFENTLKQPKYADLTTGAGFTRAPTNKWIKVRKGESASLFKELEADEAADMLYGATNKETLNRLRGMNSKSKQFANGEEIAFTLQELNATREALNSFASQTDNLVARGHARQLERGLEKQMFKLVEEGAARESGLKLGSADLKRWMKDNQWGDDIAASWKSHANAIEEGNSEAILSIVQGNRPEKVADYLLNTSVPNSRVNTPVTSLMKVLKKEGSDEVLDIQKGMAQYIRQTVLVDDGRTAFNIAKDYRKFMQENRGTLEAIFSKDGFKSSFQYSPKQFQREIIDKIAERDEIIAKIQSRWGLTDVGTGNKVTNIVETLLAAGRTPKASGEALESMKEIMKLVKNDPVLKSQISSVTKNYIQKNILQPKQGTGGLFEIDGSALENLIYRDFGPSEIVGEQLTFESFMTPLLGGDKAAREYIKNLKILNDMVQREIGPPITAGVRQQLGMGEYGIGSPIEGARMAQRLLIAPLTKLGRRITAVSNRVNDNSRRFVGEMLLDPVLLNKAMAWAEGKTNTQQFIRFLTSYGTVASWDLANEIQFYDVDEKVQKTPKKKTRQQASDILEQGLEQGRSIIGATP